MRNRTMFVVLCLVLSFVAAPAIAAGPYAGGEAGAVFLSNSTFTSAGNSDIDLKSKTGYLLGLVGGYDFGTYRLEGEFAYRKNNNKEATDNTGTFPVSGDYSTMALLVNGFYDFKMVSPTFVPYLGLGLGGARVTAKGSDSASGVFIDDSKTVFAYQLAAGVGYVVSKEITLDLGYKYFATAKPEFEYTATFGGGKAKGEYASHSVFLGARYNF